MNENGPADSLPDPVGNKPEVINEKTVFKVMITKCVKANQTFVYQHFVNNMLSDIFAVDQ